MSHGELSLEEDRVESSDLLIGKEGKGERYTINGAALRVVDYADSSM